MNEAGKELLLCPLCGFRFAAGTGCRPGCPFRSRCGLICCPQCGYQFVSESKWIGAWKRFWRGREKKEST